jgi:hypothetical protein
VARLAAILRAVARALARDQKSIWSLTGNNFPITAVAGLQEAGGLLYLIIGLVMLFPLSTDPLRKIPASRLSLWPLSGRDHWVLRVVSPWVSPMTWAVAALAVWMVRGKVSPGLLGLAAGLVALGFVVSSVAVPRNHGLWRRIPNFPGTLNQLVRKNLRAMLSTLDVYCGLLLSISTLGFRLAKLPLPREALMLITVLVVVALSSYAQCLFGLDGRGGLARYRLLPLAGWQILAAKDAAYLVLIFVLTLPLAPLAGLAGGLIALAIGHHYSVYEPRPQVRWRFSNGGPFLMLGLFQVAAIAAAVSAVFVYSVLFLIPCFAVCVGSAWWYGRVLERA